MRLIAVDEPFVSICLMESVRLHDGIAPSVFSIAESKELISSGVIIGRAASWTLISPADDSSIVSRAVFTLCERVEPPVIVM